MLEPTIKLTDTHAHLYSEEFDEDRNAVVENARQAGVDVILLPAIDSLSHTRQQDMAEKYPDICRQMMGLHPTSVKAGYEQELSIAEQLLKEHRERYVAVGEIGLDYYWDRTFAKEQRSALQSQLQWALDYDLPVSLHLRSAKEGDADAYEDFFSLLGERFSDGHPRGVMHCFSGSVEQALRAVDEGFYIGIGGVVTYKKSSMADVVAAVPLERLLLETDAPYLAPIPYRGKRNESAYIVEVAKKIAEIKGVTVQEVAGQTKKNAENLFFSCTI